MKETKYKATTNAHRRGLLGAMWPMEILSRSLKVPLLVLLLYCTTAWPVAATGRRRGRRIRVQRRNIPKTVERKTK